MQGVLWTIVNTVFGFFVGAAASLLDYALWNYVIDFGSFWSSGQVGATIDALWVNIRDIFNITFIFGLVYIGFKMILDSDNSSTKKALIHLILAALLVNFSLFFTKAVIDVSNMFATSIAYDGLPTNKDNHPSVSLAFSGGTGLSTLLGSPDLSKVIDEKGNGGYTYIFGAMIFYIVSTFVFGAGAFLLFIRFGVLLLYLIFSPFMFIGWVFPQLNSYTSKYWRGLLGRAFFAPLYILLTFIAMTIVTSINNSTPNGKNLNLIDGLNVGESAAAAANVTNYFPPFIIASILMLAAVIVASKLGADGAGAAISFGKNMTNKAKRGIQNGSWNATKWTAQQTAQQTGGRAYRHYANKLGTATSEKITQWQQKERISMAGKAGQWVANTRTFDKAGRAFGKKMENAKGGFKETTKERDDRKTQEKKTITDRNEKYEKLRNGDAVAIRSLSKNDLEELKKNDSALFNSVIGNIENLKDSTFNSFKDSDKLNQTEKDAIIESRENAVKNFVEKNGQVISENLQKLSDDQIELMGDQFVTDNAHLFSSSQIENRKKNGKFTAAQEKARKDEIVRMSTSNDEQERNSVFNHNTESNPTAYTATKKAKEIASLPFGVYFTTNSKTGAVEANKDAISQITPDVLSEMAKNKSLSVSEREQLKAEILRNGTDNSKAYLDTPEGQKNWNIRESNTQTSNQAFTSNERPAVEGGGYSFNSPESVILTPDQSNRPRENRDNT